MIFEGEKRKLEAAFGPRTDEFKQFLAELESLPEEKDAEIEDCAIFYRSKTGDVEIFHLLVVPCTSGMGGRPVKLGPKRRAAFLARAAEFDVFLGQYSMITTVMVPAPFKFQESLKERKHREQNDRSFHWDACMVRYLDKYGQPAKLMEWTMSYVAACNLAFSVVPIMEEKMWAYYKKAGQEGKQGRKVLLYPNGSYLPPDKEEDKKKGKKKGQPGPATEHLLNGYLTILRLEFDEAKRVFRRLLRWEITLDGEFIFANREDYKETRLPVAELFSVGTHEVILPIGRDGFICPPKQEKRIQISLNGLL